MKKFAMIATVALLGVGGLAYAGGGAGCPAADSGCGGKAAKTEKECKTDKECKVEKKDCKTESCAKTGSKKE